MKRAVIIVVIVLIVGYGLFEARKLIEGPVITIESPQAGTATSSDIVTVVGNAENIAFLTINDGPAYTDESGRFVYQYSPPPGYTVVTVAAVDRFGRRSSKSVVFDVVSYCPLKG
jgi:hypothetical protein